MTTSRIEVFEQILAGDPANTAVLFGLAKEYEKAGDDPKLIEILERYLASADDEGNAYGMIARAPLPSAARSKRRRRTVIRGWPKSIERFWRVDCECRAFERR